MKLSEYIQRLEEIRKRHGDDLKIVYASDDEGNSFDKTRFLPVVGKYVGDKFCAGEFGRKVEIDAVCVLSGLRPDWTERVRK